MAPEEADCWLHRRPLPVTSACDVFSFGLVLLHLSSGRASLWPASLAGAEAGTKPFFGEVGRTLVDAALLAERLPVDARWPLADVIARCLAHDPALRPSAAQLVEALLALAPRCHADRATALRAVVTLRNQWLLHPSAADRELYEAPLATTRRGLERVPAVEEKGMGLEPLPAAIDAFLDPAAARRALVLLGDGGNGKTLTLLRTAADEKVRGAWLPVLLRAGLPEWSHAELRDGLRKALRWYGMPADGASGGSERLLVLCDAYDELVDNAAADDLAATIGLAQWPNARLIVTCRRNIVSDVDMPLRFAGAALRFLLPFTPAQTVRVLQAAGVVRAAERLSGELLALLENPFTLRLFAEAARSEDVEARRADHYLNKLLRRHVYQAAADAWVVAADRAGVLSLLATHASAATTPTAAELADDHARLLERTAHAMFARGAVSLAVDDECLRAEPWGAWEARVRQAARAEVSGAAGSARSSSLLDPDQLARLRVREFRAAMARCPLQLRDRHVTFAHKSLRDFFCAKHIVRHPDAGQQLVTTDLAVLRFAAEFVEVGRTSAAVRALISAAAAAAEEKAPAGHAAEAAPFGVRALRTVLASRVPAEARVVYDRKVAVGAANCASILNVAGVSFSGLDLSGAQLGASEEECIAAERPAAFVPFAELGGAMLPGANLSRANLRRCRLQQVLLDRAKLDGLDLRGAMFGEKADFRGLPDTIRAVCCSPDGLHLFAGLDNGSIVQLDRQTKKASALHTHTHVFL